MESETSKLLYSDITNTIIGIYYDVYNEIGNGFLETIYLKAMHLRATEIEVGLLLNFGGTRPQFRRLVFENSNKKTRVHPRESAVGGSAGV